MQSLRYILLILSTSLILSSSISSQVGIKLYQAKTKTFVLDDWVVHSLYKAWEENPLLKNEIEQNYKYIASLGKQIESDSLVVGSLVNIKDNLRMQIEEKDMQIQRYATMYNMSIKSINESNVLIEKLELEVKQLKRKSVFENIISFGFGPLKLKYLVPGAAGYLLATKI